MNQAIIYTRLSKQELSHTQTGLQTQEQDARSFAVASGFEVLDVVSEISSGKYGLNVRVVLGAAIARCKKEGLTLIVSKLDRLSRDVAFISKLANEGFNFKVASLGKEADTFTINIYASLAQQERQMISERTKRALTLLKQQGKKLGTYASRMPDDVRQRAQATNRDNALAFRNTILATVRGYQLQGLSHQKMADQLNIMGVKTMLGKEWQRTGVLRLLAASESL